MRTFTDTKGRAWSISVTVASIKRVRDLAKVDLLALDSDSGSVLERMISDPIALANVLFALVYTDAQSQSISDTDFGEALAGDVIEAATNALVGELIDFFPKRRRELLHKAVEKIAAAQEIALDISEKKLDAMDPHKLVGASSISSPASSESTPPA